MKKLFLIIACVVTMQLNVFAVKTHDTSKQGKKDWSVAKQKIRKFKEIDVTNATSAPLYVGVYEKLSGKTGLYGFVYEISSGETAGVLRPDDWSLGERRNGDRELYFSKSLEGFGAMTIPNENDHINVGSTKGKDFMIYTVDSSDDKGKPDIHGIFLKAATFDQKIDDELRQQAGIVYK